MESALMVRRMVQAGEMLPLLRRHEIQVLLRAGHKPLDVAQRTGASVDTVRRVKRESAVTETDDAAERRWNAANCATARTYVSIVLGERLRIRKSSIILLRNGVITCLLSRLGVWQQPACQGGRPRSRSPRSTYRWWPVRIPWALPRSEAQRFRSIYLTRHWLKVPAWVSVLRSHARRVAR